MLILRIALHQRHRHRAHFHAVPAVEHLARRTSVQRRIENPLLLVHARLAYVKDVPIPGPGATIPRAQARVLRPSAHGVVDAARTVAGRGGERSVGAALDVGRHNRRLGIVAHVVALAVVRIGEHALRGARKVALEAGRQTGSGFVGAALARQVAVEAVVGVAQLDGHRLPLAVDDQTAGDEFAALANEAAERSVAASVGLTAGERDEASRTVGNAGSGRVGCGGQRLRGGNGTKTRRYNYTVCIFGGCFFV